MQDKKNKQAEVPESWKVSEEKIQAEWDKKSEQFSEFKKKFEGKFQDQ